MIKNSCWQGWATTDQWVATEGVTVDLALLIDRHRLDVTGAASQTPGALEIMILKSDFYFHRTFYITNTKVGRYDTI